MTKKIRKLKHSVKIILFSILIIMIISGFNIIDSKLKNIDESNKIVVTIDMGHGGKDQGTTNQSEDIIEKNITLQIGEKLAKELDYSERWVQAIINKNKIIVKGEEK